MRKVGLFILLVFFCVLASEGKKKQNIPAPYAWSITQPLGLRYDVPMDTLMHNFYSTDIPSSYSTAYGTTGNLGGAAFSKIFFDRGIPSEFFFKDPFSHWIQTASTWKFYNTHIPFTQLSYLTGGSKQTAQDDLKAVFSGNINPRLALGGSVNYILSRGNYQHQATKDLAYSIFGSYLGDRYDIQFFLNTYNFVNQENGGITDDTYILNPEEVQGGQASVDTRTIPTNLSDAYNRIRGKEYYATQRYTFGFYQEEQQDTTVIRTFVPVTSIIHTIEYNENKHRFVNQSATEDTTFFANTYMGLGATNQETTYQSLRNTAGTPLLHGFNKHANMGLAAYLTYEYRHYSMPRDTLSAGTVIEGLTPRPDFSIPRNHSENLLWVGGELSKQKGELLTYNVNGKFGLAGSVIGDIDVTADVRSRFRLWKDTVQLQAYGFFKNIEPSYFYKRYASNHFMWNNSFGKTRRMRVGGELSVKRWGTKLNVGVENIQNYIYFDNNCLPQQEGSIIQVFQARLDQNFRLGILNWENEVVYQKTSKPSIIPLPELSVYSNLYLLFRIAKVLHVQLGIDCRYYTKYKSETFQPATLTFHTQDQIEVGNYPFMNAYINMKLKQTRFFVMMSHVNQGLFGGNNYFSLPHYPLNPRMFQMGLSIDFSN